MLSSLLGIAAVVANTFVLYLFVMLAFRLVGRRQITELTPAELVVVMLLGSAVETSLVAGNKSLAAGLASAATLFVANRGFSAVVRRSMRLREVLLGKPVLLIHNGKLNAKRAAEIGLTEEDVRQAIRKRGFADFGEVRFGVLEVDGDISVVPRSH